MGNCSLPRWIRFGGWSLKDWFDAEFGDICDAHDAAYVARPYRHSFWLDLLDKTKADSVGWGRIVRRKWWLVIATPVAIIGSQTAGYYYWYWRE